MLSLELSHTLCECTRLLVPHDVCFLGERKFPSSPSRDCWCGFCFCSEI